MWNHRVWLANVISLSVIAGGFELSTNMASEAFGVDVVDKQCQLLDRQF